MKKIITVILVSALLAACGGNSEKNRTDNTSNSSTGNSNSKELITDTKAPEGISFQRKTFGKVSFEMPTGADWEVDGKQIYNNKTGMVIQVQNQPDGFQDQQEDFAASYNDNNTRDAKGWKLSKQEFGTIKKLPAAASAGTFNNGTAFVVRDFIFFGDTYTSLLQVRVPEKDKELLVPMADYIAHTYQFEK